MKLKIFIICILVLLAILIPVYLKADSKVVIEEPKLTVATSTPEFERIALCESHGDLHAKNKYSSASGEFQFIYGSWYHYGLELWGQSFYTKNIWTSDNRDLAWYVYTKYGTSDWNSSRNCWNVVK